LIVDPGRCVYTVGNLALHDVRLAEEEYPASAQMCIPIDNADGNTYD
jgi:hypothetical protein